MIKNNKHENSAFDLDWGQVTPEKYNESTKEALYVCNFNMMGDENRNIVKLFLAGKILWYSNHLPTGTTHRVRIDLRGQYISFEKLRVWKLDLIERILSKNADIVMNVEFHVS